MKKSLFLSLSTVLMAVLLFTACQKDKVEAVADTQPQATEETNYYTPALGDFVTSRSGYWTEIPAGSVDALNQAIAEADAGGVIYLKAGMHTETDRVTVDKRVAIIGEDGAVLKIASTDTVSSMNPALCVLDAPGTLIKNVAMEPHGNGAHSAVLFENSHQSAMLQNKITGFPLGILIEKSDRVTLIGNTLSGDGTDKGVLVNNGKSTYIADNEISGFDIGIWACDQWGTAEGNNCHHNAAGFLLCKYNAVFGATIPSSDVPIGAELTATGWKIRHNHFTDNAEAGLSIRDGANQNLVEVSNEYSDNPYDILIQPDETFPFVPPLFVPSGKNNTIHAAPGVKIKDCGIDNTINGGELVDTSQDPC